MSLVRILFGRGIPRFLALAQQHGMTVKRASTKNGFRTGPACGSRYAIWKGDDLVLHGDNKTVVQYFETLQRAVDAAEASGRYR
jgi:hypothetical protein